MNFRYFLSVRKVRVNAGQWGIQSQTIQNKFKTNDEIWGNGHILCVQYFIASHQLFE